ncbi:MAG: endogenous inhibitor of DNA gyrase (YacG/DUF329 family) [Thermoproteota archaeon]|jgi:endogenous inhibitor of DNA gyrase (YacG/DUF329 family)
MTKKVLKVKCPECDVEFNYYSSENRPFCTEKCRMVDLGLWLNQGYSLPSNEPIDEIEYMEKLKEQEDSDEDEELLN